MRAYLLIDIGSTYTKVTMIDAARPALLGQAQAPTTAATDVSEGLEAALRELRGRYGRLPRFTARLAASSAAGGLRLAAVGLVPDLTAQAARQAALGAGARVIAAYAYRLGPEQLDDLRARRPDMILLAGGTDGGNADVVLHNAQALAEAGLAVPVVYAGNADAADQVVRLLRSAGLEVRTAANVMPRLRRLQVEPAREAIRDLFMLHIVRAKGLDRARRRLDGILMPTPAAVLRAARLLADGPGDGGGLGPLLVVDVGGATTDVHSIGPGAAVEPGVVQKGLEEPYAKRTVEGDLGMRVSAPSLLAAVGAERLRRLMRGAPGAVSAGEEGADALTAYVARLGADTRHVPADAWQRQVEYALARAAVDEAVLRHAGRLRQVEGPFGRRRLQYGKDLRPVRTVVGTGGVFLHAAHPEYLLAGAAYDPDEPEVLRPRDARAAVDARYLLAPMGLLAEHEPGAAYALLRRSLRWLGPLGPAAGG